MRLLIVWLLLCSITVGCSKRAKQDVYCDPIIEYDYPMEYSHEVQKNAHLYQHAPLFQRTPLNNN